MKLTVILEQHFYQFGDEYWAEVQCDQKFWDRYLNVFDEIVVCARVSQPTEDTKKEKLLRSDRENVSFIALPNFRGPKEMIKKGAAVSKVLKEAIAMGDCAICRVPSPIILLASSHLKNSGKPYAIEVVVNPKTAFSKDSIATKLQPVIQRVFIWNTKKICLDANGASYVTNHALQQEYPCTAIVKGESDEYFTSSYSTINLKESDYQLADWPEERPDEITLVHVGTMGDLRKGQDIFIEALSILRKKGYAVRGILVGDGPMRNNFEQQCAEAFGEGQDIVEFAGWKAGFQAVQKEMQRGQFFVFPTASEGLPRAVIEAMASGVVGIGYDVDGMSELLEGRSLVGQRTPEAFAECIEYYIQNWDETTRYRLQLFEKSKNYAADILNGRRTEFYSKLYALAEKTR